VVRREGQFGGHGRRWINWRVGSPNGYNRGAQSVPFAPAREISPMTTNRQPREVPPTIRAKLEDLYLRVDVPAAAELAWERLLTERERQRLGGDLEACLERKGSLVNLWRELKKFSQPRAILELAHALHLVTELDYQWICRELGEEEKRSPTSKLPVWSREPRTLSFEGKLIRRIRSLKVACNVVKILDVFEERRWPSRIGNPLHDPVSIMQIHQAVHSLNKGLTGIIFHVDGDGTSVTWSRRRTTGPQAARVTGRSPRGRTKLRRVSSHRRG